MRALTNTLPRTPLAGRPRTSEFLVYVWKPGWWVRCGGRAGLFLSFYILHTILGDVVVLYIFFILIFFPYTVYLSYNLSFMLFNTFFSTFLFYFTIYTIFFWRGKFFFHIFSYSIFFLIQFTFPIICLSYFLIPFFLNVSILFYHPFYFFFFF